MSPLIIIGANELRGIVYITTLLDSCCPRDHLYSYHIHAYVQYMLQDAVSPQQPSYISVPSFSDCPSGMSYGLSVSERLGRTSSKEQYAFMYR